jgi:hypothetical protein
LIRIKATARGNRIGRLEVGRRHFTDWCTRALRQSFQRRQIARRNVLQRASDRRHLEDLNQIVDYAPGEVETQVTDCRSRAIAAADVIVRSTPATRPIQSSAESFCCRCDLALRASRRWQGVSRLRRAMPA